MSEQTNPIRDAIAQAIGENRVILFMKGTPDQPTCGLSARTSPVERGKWILTNFFTSPPLLVERSNSHSLFVKTR